MIKHYFNIQYIFEVFQFSVDQVNTEMPTNQQMLQFAYELFEMLIILQDSNTFRFQSVSLSHFLAYYNSRN